MSRKGLSAEEKRKRMLEFFHERRIFFNSKEVEQICSKQKGITAMSVKDILQSLVDDELVDSDKIGTSVYYWAYPSKAGQTRKRKLEGLMNDMEGVKRSRKTLDETVSQLMAERGSAPEKRTEMLDRIKQLEAEIATVDQRLAALQDCDPELLVKLEEQVKTTLEGANRWTDNLFSIFSWLEKKFPNFNKTAYLKQCGLPEDFDYLD